MSQAEGDVSKLTRTWVIYSMCHQARDGDKGREGRNQADILWYMFTKALFIIQLLLPGITTFNHYFQLLIGKKVYSFVKSAGTTSIILLWRSFAINFLSRGKK